MILSELNKYYLRLLEDDNIVIPPRGWSNEKVVWALPIGKDGSLGSPIYQGGEGKGDAKYRYMMVPEHDLRTGKKFLPYFLCDTAAYLLGLEEKNGAVKHRMSREMHLEVIADCVGPKSDALRVFFSREDPSRDLSDTEREALTQGGLCVLLFEDGKFAHDDEELVQAWHSCWEAQGADDSIGQCGVTGEVRTLSRLFPQVTGIPGAQTSGASLVSFNRESFESYNKSQGYNASISKDVAFGAGTALKYLFQDERHHVRMGGMTVVFWADRPAALEDALMLQMLGGRATSAEDDATLQLVGAALDRIRSGKGPITINAEVRYFMLGVSPNAARLAVRFFETETLGQLAEHYGQYLRDIDIDCASRFAERKTTALLGLLRQTALLGKDENLPATLVNPCLRAMLHGTSFPSSLETALLSRMRADRATNKPWDMMERASLMKACVVRKWRLLSQQASGNEREVTVALNRENRNVGYVLGRLFAVMEYAQQGAQGDIGSTVRDKYMSSAATTPARVFTNLLSLCQKHLGTMRREVTKRGRANYIEKELEQIFDLLDGGEQPIPATLTNDDQLMFYIGFYQERTFLWQKRDNSRDGEVRESNNNEEA